VTLPRDFSTSGFFHESVSPLSIPLGPFQIYRKFVEIFAAQGAPLVSLMWQMEKNLNQKSFHYFLDTFG
jgi:hypothetical protein